MNKVILWILTIGTAFSISSIYLSQPLLNLLALQFSEPISKIGLIVTLTQIGYALGIFFLVPIGDIVSKKKLILLKLLGMIIVLLIAGTAKTLPVFLIASLIIGVFASATQDYVPLAADLAIESERGRVLGTVVSGLLLGILLSRTFSGSVAHLFGWRFVYFMAMFFMGVIFLLTFFFIPTQKAKIQLKYTDLMKSMGHLLKENPLLQYSILCQGCLGIIFSSFWTTLTFYLSASPFHFATSTIGFFGLIGAAGAIAAPIAGRLTDKKSPLINIQFAIITIFSSFLIMLFFKESIIALIIGMIFFDLGVQTGLISHQAIIYAINPKAKSRINSLFVTSLFIFFAIGSFFGTLIFTRFGFRGVVVMSLCCCVLSFIFYCLLRDKYKETSNKNLLR